MNNLLTVTNNFKRDDGVIIVIKYVPYGDTPEPKLCVLASPGMCFFFGNVVKDVISDTVQALCIGIFQTFYWLELAIIRFFMVKLFQRTVFANLTTSNMLRALVLL